jgi:hypothetical protein
MINFKPKNLVDRGYSIHIPGNKGEEELVIFTSWGKDQRSSLVIVTCSCDGLCTVVYDSKKRVILATILTQVDKALIRWFMKGDKPDATQLERLAARRLKIMDVLIDKWTFK